jgi:hypothetical protein
MLDLYTYFFCHSPTTAGEHHFLDGKFRWVKKVKLWLDGASAFMVGFKQLFRFWNASASSLDKSC